VAEKFTKLCHKTVIKLHLVAESCTICSSRSRRPVRKLLNTPSYIFPLTQKSLIPLNCRKMMKLLIYYDNLMIVHSHWPAFCYSPLWCHTEIAYAPNAWNQLRTVIEGFQSENGNCISWNRSLKIPVFLDNSNPFKC